MGLVHDAVPVAELDAAVQSLCDRIKGVPRNQLMMSKLVVNQAYENMGLASTQMLANFFDGIARHSPEGLWFRQRATEVGFKQAVAERDSGEPIAPGQSKRMKPGLGET
jgi:enoyl-CoA hydratase